MAGFTSKIKSILKEYSNHPDNRLPSDDPMTQLLLEAIFSKASELDDFSRKAKDEITDGVLDYLTNNRPLEIPFILGSCFPKKGMRMLINAVNQYCVEKDGEKILLSSPESHFSVVDLKLEFIAFEDTVHQLSSEVTISLSNQIGRKYALGFECPAELLEMNESITLHLGILPSESRRHWYHSNTRYMQISHGGKILEHSRGWRTLVPPDGVNYLKYGTWTYESALMDYYKPYIYSFEINPNELNCELPQPYQQVQRILDKEKNYFWIDLAFLTNRDLPSLDNISFHINCVPFLNKGLNEEANSIHNNGIIEITGRKEESVLAVQSIKHDGEVIMDFDVQNGSSLSSKNVILNGKPNGNVHINYWVTQTDAVAMIDLKDEISDYHAGDAPIDSHSIVVHTSELNAQDRTEMDETAVFNRLFLSQDNLFSREDIKAFIRDHIGEREIDIHFGYGSQYNCKNPKGIEPVIEICIESKENIESSKIDLKHLEYQLNSRTSGIYPIVIKTTKG